MFELYSIIDIDFLKIVYVLSFFVSSTIFGFMYLKREKNKNKIFIVLSFWLLMYGIKEFFFLFLESNELFFLYLKQILAILSSFLIYYLFFENIKNKIFFNRFKKRIILLLSLLLLLSLYFYKELIPFFVFTVGLFGAYYFYLDCKRNNNNEKIDLSNILSIIFIIILSFLFFGRNTFLFENSNFKYFYFILTPSLFYLTSFLLINNFIKNESLKVSSAPWSMARKIVVIFFIIFLAGLYSLNFYILNNKNKYFEELLTYKDDEIDALVSNFNNYNDTYNSFSRIFTQNKLLKDFLSSYYSTTSPKILVDKEIEDINSPLYTIIDDYVNASKISVLYVMDIDGNTILSSNRNTDASFIGKNYSFRPYFSGALSGGDSVYFAKGVTSGEKGAYYASPVYLEGEIQGVVVAKLPKEIFDNFFASKEGLFLLSPSGVIFAATNKELEDKALFKKEDQEHNTLNLKLRANNLYKGMDGSYFLNFKSINVPGWNVGIIEKYSSLDEIIFRIAMFTYIIVLFYMLLYYLVSNYFLDEFLVRIAEKKYKDIFENANDFIFVLNKKGEIEFSNKAFKKVFGNSDKLRIKNLMHKENYYRYRQKVRFLDKNASNFKIDLELINLNKKNVYLKGEFSVEDKVTDKFRLQGIFRDVSPEKILEDKLKSTNKELKLLLSEAEKDKNKQEAQRLATLNILEDVSETQEKLETNNKELEQKSSELSSLAVLGGEFANISDIDKLINKVKKYLGKNINSEIISFFVKTDDSKDNIYYGTFYNNIFSKDVVENINLKISNYVSKNFGFSKDEISILQNKKAIITNNEKKSLDIQSEIFLNLVVSGKKLGFIHLVSSKKNAYSESAKNYLEIIASSFSIALANAQQLNKAQQSKTHSLVRTLSNGILMFDLNNNLSLINPAGEKFCEVSANGEGLDDFFERTSKYKIRDCIKKSLEKGKMSKIEEVIIEKNKIKKIYQVLVTPIHDYEKKIIGSAVAMQDVTHLKYIDKMKTEFVSVASHQLRTPLTAIKLFTEMLVNEQVGKISSEQKKYLSNVYDSTERMVGLVNDLLNVTRIESGRLMVSPIPTDISNFLSSLIQEASALAKTKNIKITLTNKTKLSSVPLDQSLIRQVYHNLLTNAIRYTKNGGIVKVNIISKKPSFVVSVKDEGIGIPKNSQNRIFEKFFRADNAVKVATEGTGLGLYVSKMIVESSDGKIWFKSKENFGTTFYVSLPIKGMKKKKGERGLSVS